MMSLVGAVQVDWIKFQQETEDFNYQDFSGYCVENKYGFSEDLQALESVTIPDKHTNSHTYMINSVSMIDECSRGMCEALEKESDGQRYDELDKSFDLCMKGLDSQEMSVKKLALELQNKGFLERFFTK